VRYLLLSDIHSNWEALQAVLQDAAGEYDAILCCGDLVGYCADPNRVIDWCRANLKAIVRGNHDKVVAGLDGLEWFNPIAQAASLWTRGELSPANLEYLTNLPRGPIPVDDFVLAHGAPIDEDEYLTDIFEARQAFNYVERAVTFVGHTHLQGGFRLETRNVEKIGRPDLHSSELLLDIKPDSWYLVNPGSVGQPRDRDSRAAYAIHDSGQRLVAFRRVAYDVGTTQAKIRRAGLPDSLAHRLASGR
jgi:diadenosine tetraphosphatase ApaH/serine/threonine PP2A family protein phosphatase